MSNKAIIALAVPLLVVGIALLIWASSSNTPSQGKQQPPEQTGSNQQPDAAPEQIAPEHPDARQLAKVLNTDLSSEHRVLALKNVSDSLTLEQQKQLLEIVKLKTAHPTLRNDVLSALERQREKLPELAEVLIAMWNDETEKPRWRDYVLQHLPAVYDFAPEPEKVKDVLEQVARSGGERGGTALISLQRMARKHDELRNVVSDIATDQMSDVEADATTTIVALEMKRQSNDESGLPKARRIATDETAAARLRMAAIGTIGELGNATDIPALEKLTQDSDSRVRRVAEYQLKQLKERVRAE
jgi:hypothetical protein